MILKTTYVSVVCLKPLKNIKLWVQYLTTIWSPNVIIVIVIDIWQKCQCISGSGDGTRLRRLVATLVRGCVDGRVRSTGVGHKAEACGDALFGFVQIEAAVVVEPHRYECASIAGSDAVRVETLLKARLVFGEHRQRFARQQLTPGSEQLTTLVTFDTPGIFYLEVDGSATAILSLMSTEPEPEPEPLSTLLGSFLSISELYHSLIAFLRSA